jgi:hypothetical protein
MSTNLGRAKRIAIRTDRMVRQLISSALFGDAWTWQWLHRLLQRRPTFTCKVSTPYEVRCDPAIDRTFMSNAFIGSLHQDREVRYLCLLRPRRSYVESIDPNAQKWKRCTIIESR